MAGGVQRPQVPREGGARLLPNVPNPFNPATEIRYTLERPGNVQLTVFDIRGRRVRKLFDGHRPAGPGAVNWDGRLDSGAGAAAGLAGPAVTAATPRRPVRRV